MPVEIEINGLQINFPFEPYPAQRTFMHQMVDALRAGSNALLESPTGTGKTLCLLCVALAWRKLQESGGGVKDELTVQLDPKAMNNSAPTIIYVSRTHSQLGQVIAELKRAHGSAKTVVLGARQNQCVHPQVSKLPAMELKSSCTVMVKNRTCTYYNGVDERMVASASKTVMDIEDMATFGAKHKVCPYYLYRDTAMLTTADIIFMPYNFLIDPSVRRGLGDLPWKDAIVIVDEAHNLEKICDEAASFSLSTTDLARCVDEAGRQGKRVLEETDDVDFAERIAKLQKIFVKLLEDLDAEVIMTLPGDNRGRKCSGSYAFKFFEGAGITENNWEHASVLIKEIIQMASSSSGAADNSNSATYLVGLEAFDRVLTRLYASIDARQRAEQFYRVFVEEKADAPSTNTFNSNKGSNNNRSSNDKFGRSMSFGADFGGSNSGGGGWKDKGKQQQQQQQQQQLSVSSSRKSKARVLHFWCFSPGVTLGDVRALGVGPMVLTSGTLAPLKSFAAQMREPFPHTLEGPHVIDNKRQLWLGVVTKGVLGKHLNSSYKYRSTPAYQTELGSTVANFARIIPQGLLVFFPSYPVMTACLDSWRKDVGLWQRIQKYKTPFVEPKGAAAMQQVVGDYEQTVDSGEGAIFFAVCRGKASEGIDFSDHRARGVIVTGLPFSPMMDPQVVMKREYLDYQSRLCNKPDMKLSGNDWYVQEACRAVNQALGRVIRHKNDFGAMILLDERFASPSNRKCLSAWLQPSWHVCQSFGPVAAELSKFFNNAKNDPELQLGKSHAGGDAVDSPNTVAARRRRASRSKIYDSNPVVWDRQGKDAGFETGTTRSKRRTCGHGTSGLRLNYEYDNQPPISNSLSLTAGDLLGQASAASLSSLKPASRRRAGVDADGKPKPAPRQSSLADLKSGVAVAGALRGTNGVKRAYSGDGSRTIGKKESALALARPAWQPQSSSLRKNSRSSGSSTSISSSIIHKQPISLLSKRLQAGNSGENKNSNNASSSFAQSWTESNGSVASSSDASIVPPSKRVKEKRMEARTQAALDAKRKKQERLQAFFDAAKAALSQENYKLLKMIIRRSKSTETDSDSNKAKVTRLLARAKRLLVDAALNETFVSLLPPKLRAFA